MSNPEHNFDFDKWRKEYRPKPMYCMVCRADITEEAEKLHDEMDKAEDPGQIEYGVWCPECGTFVVPLEGKDLPY